MAGRQTRETHVTDAAFWNRIAEKYARDPIKDVAAYEATLARIAAHLRPEDRVLEIGCGTGGTARRLAPLVASVTATDISVEMIRIARTRQETEGTTVRFEASPVGAPVEGAPFDVVCAFSVLHLTGDLTETLARVREKLRPGGLFIAKTPCLGDMSVAIRLVIPILRLFGRAPDVTSFTAQQLLAAIRQAGFEIVEETTFGSDRHRRFTVARRL